MNRNEHADSERAAATGASRGENRQAPEQPQHGSPDAATPPRDDSALMRNTAVQGEDPQRDSRAPDVARDRDHPTQPSAGDTPRAAGGDAASGTRGD